MTDEFDIRLRTLTHAALHELATPLPKPRIAPIRWKQLVPVGLAFSVAAAAVAIGLIANHTNTSQPNFIGQQPAPGFSCLNAVHVVPGCVRPPTELPTAISNPSPSSPPPGEALVYLAFPGDPSNQERAFDWTGNQVGTVTFPANRNYEDFYPSPNGQAFADFARGVIIAPNGAVVGQLLQPGGNGGLINMSRRWAEDNQHMCEGGADTPSSENSFSLYELAGGATPRLVTTASGGNWWVASCSVVNNLAVIARDAQGNVYNEVRVVQLSTGKVINDATASPGYAIAAISPDGRYFAETNGTTIVVRSLANGNVLAHLQREKQSVNGFTDNYSAPGRINLNVTAESVNGFSSDGSLLIATATGGGTAADGQSVFGSEVLVVNWNTQQIVTTLPGVTVTGKGMSGQMPNDTVVSDPGGGNVMVQQQDGQASYDDSTRLVSHNQSGYHIQTIKFGGTGLVPN